MFKTLPLYYFYATRLKDISGIIKYFIFPVLYFLVLFFDFWNLNILIFLFNFVLFYNFYEIFYYFNDYNSYDKEKNWIKRWIWEVNKNLFLLSKILFLLILLWVSYFCLFDYFFLYIWFLFLTWIVFYLHNNLSEKFRFLTFILLYFLKYLFFWIAIIQSQNFFLFWVIVFVISIGSSLDYVNRKNSLNIPKPFLILDLLVFALALLTFFLTDNFYTIIYSIFILILKIFFKKY